MSVTLEIDPLGRVAVTEERIYEFPTGLPGFNHVKRFAFVEHDDYLPFAWMVAVDQPDLAFVVVDPRFFCANYRPRLSPEDLIVLGLKGRQDAAKILAIVTIPSDPRDLTLNLRGPVVLNPARRIGRQAILAGHDYSTRHPVRDNVDADAGTGAAGQGARVAVQSQGRRDECAGTHP